MEDVRTFLRSFFLHFQTRQLRRTHQRRLIRTITGFNPKTDVLALDWFGGTDLRLSEEAGSAVLKIPSM